MNQYFSEITVFIVGTLIALSSLWNIPEINNRKRIYRLMYYTGIACVIILQAIQLNFSITNKLEGRKYVERSSAMSLYGFKENNIDILQKAANDPYIIGYRHFANGDLEVAKYFFEKSILQGVYVSPSHYLLAFMAAYDSKGNLKSGDWSEAYKHIDKSISYDKYYAPAYYLRATLKANSNQLSSALEDLENAVLNPDFGFFQCIDINSQQEIDKVFSLLKNDPKLNELQAKCSKIYRIEK